MRIRTIVREIPDSRLLTETDAPGAMRWLRGDTGWPLDLEMVVEAIPEVKKTTPMNEEKQLRLGLGQVLRYRQILSLQHRGRNVITRLRLVDALRRGLAERG